MGRTYNGDYSDRLKEGQATVAGAPAGTFLDTLTNPILFCSEARTMMS